MELMYFVIRHMEEASRVKRERRRSEKTGIPRAATYGKQRHIYL